MKEKFTEREIEKFKVIDARSKERFEGKAKEPRKGLRSGSIPNSICLPFRELINENNTFKNNYDIRQIFYFLFKNLSNIIIIFKGIIFIN